MIKQLPYLLIIFSNIIGGGNIVIGHIGKDYFSPFIFALSRWSIAFLLFTPFIWRKFREEYKVLLEYKAPLIIMALTGVAGYNTIMYFAFHFTNSINAGIVNAIAPIVIAMLSIFIINEELSKIQIIGIFLSVLGLVFIISEGSIQKFLSILFNRGDILVIIAVICWGVYSVFIKKYLAQLPTYSCIYATMFLGVLMLLPFGIWELYQPSFRFILEPKSVFVLFYVGFLASIVSLLSWNIGVSKIGAAKAGIFLNLVPIFSIIFAIVFEKESLMWYQIIGGLIVIVGVLLSSIHRSKFKILFRINTKKVG